MTVVPPAPPYTVPKNNLNLSIKTEPVTVGEVATVYVWLLDQLNVFSKSQTFKYRWIRSSRDKLGFQAEILIIFWDSVAKVIHKQSWALTATFATKWQCFRANTLLPVYLSLKTFLVFWHVLETLSRCPVLFC